MTFSNLPNLQSFETGYKSFSKTTSLSLSSMIIKFDYLKISNLPNLQEMIIGEGCFNEWKGDLLIVNYPNLEKIVVKEWSLIYLKSLKICNNDKLKTVEVEEFAFWNVKNVIIESI